MLQFVCLQLHQAKMFLSLIKSKTIPQIILETIIIVQLHICPQVGSLVITFFKKSTTQNNGQHEIQHNSPSVRQFPPPRRRSDSWRVGQSQGDALPPPYTLRLPLPPGRASLTVQGEGRPDKPPSPCRQHYWGPRPCSGAPSNVIGCFVIFH